MVLEGLQNDLANYPNHGLQKRCHYKSTLSANQAPAQVKSPLSRKHRSNLYPKSLPEGMPIVDASTEVQKKPSKDFTIKIKLMYSIMLIKLDSIPAPLVIQSAARYSDRQIFIVNFFLVLGDYNISMKIETFLDSVLTISQMIYSEKLHY